MHQNFKARGSSRQRKIARICAQLLFVVIIFTLGLLIGDGRISFHKRIQSLNNGLPATLDYSSINSVYQALKDNYYQGLTETQLLDGLKHGLAEATNDPYTEYFTASEAKALNGQINNSFSGIGAELGKDSDGNLEVISPIQGFPAQQAGLQAKDLITSINGESTSGMLLDDAVNKIRGPEGTKVALQILRDGSQALTISITRQNINLPSVTTKTLNGNIGYMQISTFATDTTDLSQKAATSFANEHVKGIILDLRNNPGGYLDAAIHLSSLWLPQGQKILDEKRGSQVVNSYMALGGDILHGINSHSNKRWQRLS
jgi:carboxyl-terminal processing protease